MNKKIFILSCILFFAFILRVWNISFIPPGLNRDEAAIGYNAYSLLLTGKDEYGVSFPLSIKSFGDWKLPLYIYADIPFIRLFSLNEFSVKLPSILFGTLTVLLVYLACRNLFEFHPSRSRISLLAAIFLSVSPWHIHFSRVTSEANLSAFFVMLGLLLFLYGFTKFRYFIWSSFIFSLSLYTYHGSHIFSLLLFMGLVIILLQKRVSQKSLWIFILPFIFMGLVIFSKTLTSADKTKISGLTPLSDQYLVYENTVLRRLDYADPGSLVPRVFQNKYVYLVSQVMVNYLRGFSVDFLFVSGGGNLQHNIPGFGNFYIWDTFFLISGIYYILKTKHPWRYLLLYWLLISPLPASITKDAPHSARMFALLPLPQILMGFGFMEIVKLWKNVRWRYLTGSLILILLVVNFSVFMNKYFIHFPKMSEIAWGNGYKKLVTKVNAIESNYWEIAMDKPDYSPYIYFLFYNRFDPAIFQKNADRYIETGEGFQHVLGFDKYVFRKFDWGSDEAHLPGTLLISYPNETPPSATNSSYFADENFIKRIQSKYNNSFGLERGDFVKNKIVDKVILDNGQDFLYLIGLERIPKITDPEKNI